MNLLLLFILGGIWGTSFLFIKIIVTEVPPLTLVTGRLTIASLIIWSILRAQGTKMPRERKLWRTYAILGFFNGALPYSLISWGEQYIPSGLAALLQSMTPIFTVILAHFVTSDDRITGKKILGVLLGFTGVGLLMWPELHNGVQASLWGILAIVASSLSYAGATLYARHHLQKQPPMVSSAGQFTMALLIMLPLSLLIDQPFYIRPSAQALLSWVGLALLGTVLAYALYFKLLNRTHATFVTMTTYIVPINGLILGALILNETISTNIVLSLVLIFSGILLVRTPDPQGNGE